MYIDTLSFKFFIQTDRYSIGDISVGQFLKGNGDIHMDSYVWVLCFEKYENHPNIFYNFVVENIFEVTISEDYIVGAGNGLRFPCSLRNDKYSDNDIKEVNRIGSNKDIVFYLLNLREIDKIIGLYKWNRLKRLPDSYINDIFRSSDLVDIIIALTHSDQKTIDRYLACSKLFDKEEKLKYAVEHYRKGWIPPKYISDKRKVHLVKTSKQKASYKGACDNGEVN